MAVTSLVLGIVSIVVVGIGLLASIPGMILGLVSRGKLKRAGGKTGMALAGTLTSAAGLLIHIALGVAVCVIVMHARVQLRRIECMNTLHQTGMCIAMMQADRPDSTRDWTLTDLLRYSDSESDLFRCPADGNWRAGQTSYFVFAGDPARDLFDQPAACDFKGNHPDGRNVLFFDGSVHHMTEMEFQEFLCELRNRPFAKALQAAEAAGQRSLHDFPKRPAPSR